MVVDLLLGMLLCVLILAFDRARDGGDALGPAMTRIAAPASWQTSAVAPPS